ncbi:MAG TPA: putative Ig domain-containing protein, partial [Acidimicrobiales bacterium]|nr:putative Ig domain-containing protein [Acidimicrobiales bacterium]
FVNNFANWMKANNVEYANYFDFNSGGNSVLTDFPNSLAAYQADFGSENPDVQGPPPAQGFTSMVTATASVGSPFTFLVTTTGPSTPTLKMRGRLPEGLSFVDNGNGTATISGTPFPYTTGLRSRLTGGRYHLMFLATFTSGGARQVEAQAFTLDLDQAPVIIIGAPEVGQVGRFFDFKVRAKGFPVSSLTESGALPSGMAFTTKGNGRARLVGRPASGTAGVYPVTITASDIVGTATQSFNVVAMPSLTGAPLASS